MEFSRRQFLGTTVAAGAAAVLAGRARAQGTAKYTRYNATSPQGGAMLESYAVAIGKMLALPPTDARNWFRNALIHTLDCPHGNWWFFPWHRGYLGWFERTIRELSGNANFAMPYWDWTQLRQIPDQMFNGVLTPTDAAYNPYISSYQTFFDYVNPPLTAFWDKRTPDQGKQLDLRGYKTLDAVWTQIKNNPMYATTPSARYLTRQDPALDCSTSAMCASAIIRTGLWPTTFIPFSSEKTPSHNSSPSSATQWGVLEGLPHNNVHNNIGGINHVQPPDYGYMQDNLSPVDPVFFLHHSNMDRLWDVWTRKQQKLGLPTLPTGPDLATWQREPFLFFINPQGNPVTANTAGDYATIGDFDYTYQPGSGEAVIAEATGAAAAAAKAKFSGKVQGSAGSVSVGSALLNQAAASGTMVAKVTLPHPSGSTAPRNFDVLVNAPPGISSVSPDSPYYAGTIAFFGAMPGMAMNVTFHVPLTKALVGLRAAKLLGANELRISIVPHAPVQAGPRLMATPPAQLRGVSVEVW